jgi:hypothetical protein
MTPLYKQLLAAITVGILIISAVNLVAGAPGQHAEKSPYGFTDTPFLPGSQWRVHDAARPLPPVIAPGTESTPERAGKAPSDAVVLFDGTDLSHWTGWKNPERVPATWKVGPGYFEASADGQGLMSHETFGDCQLHIEWASPAEVKYSGQGRGNSGVYLMGRYEIQILDSFNNPTYADGHAGAIYGQYPPLVNVSRKPGEWQSFDIVFEAPRFEDGKLLKPAYATIFHNGVLVVFNQAIIGSSTYAALAAYTPHPPEDILLLQNHGSPVRFRNVWVRRLTNWK